MEATRRRDDTTSETPDSDAAFCDEVDAVHEQMILRFVAPALGVALDDGTLDRARVQVFLEATVGDTSGVIAAAVTAVLPDAARLSLDDLAERLADALDHAEQLDATTAGLESDMEPEVVGYETDLHPLSAPGPERPAAHRPASVAARGRLATQCAEPPVPMSAVSSIAPSGAAPPGSTPLLKDAAPLAVSPLTREVSPVAMAAGRAGGRRGRDAHDELVPTMRCFARAPFCRLGRSPHARGPPSPIVVSVHGSVRDAARRRVAL